MNNTIDTDDPINDIDRYFLQTQALITAVSHEHNIDELKPGTILNVLWLIGEQIDRMKESFTEALNLAKRAEIKLKDHNLLDPKSGNES